MMKRLLKFIVFFYCMIWMGNTAYAETEKVIYSDITAYINGLPIPSYNFYGTMVVIAKELENYGFDLNYVDEERCLYIEYNPEKEVTANYDPQKENKKFGSVAFPVQATDIYARIDGISTRGTSYSVNRELLISMNELKEQHSCYVTWYEKERKICFDYMPYWEINPDIDYEKEKNESISSFVIEFKKTEQKETNEFGKEQSKFHVNGKNEQYLSSFRIIWCEKTPVRDFNKNWFENGKIIIDFCIREDTILKAKQLIQLLNSILTINSEGNVVSENIAAANKHIKVSINRESVSVSAVELRPDFDGYTYYIELDKEIKNLEEIQSITIECK